MASGRQANRFKLTYPFAQQVTLNACVGFSNESFPMVVPIGSPLRHTGTFRVAYPRKGNDGVGPLLSQELHIRVIPVIEIQQ